MLPLELPLLELEVELAPLIALDSALFVLLTPEIVLMNASSKDVRCHRAAGKAHAVTLISESFARRSRGISDGPRAVRPLEAKSRPWLCAMAGGTD
jgi:hypothetical protein